MTEIKFVYNSPDFLLNTSILLYKECMKNEKIISLENQSLFIINTAATIESFMNWFYYFEKDIDVDNYNGKRMNTREKRLNLPISDLNKRRIKAIIDFRTQIMHPKYKPREASNEIPFTNIFMLYFLGSSISILNELISVSSNKLKDRISLKNEYLEILEKSENQKIIDQQGNELSWLDLIENKRVGLPIPSLGHI